MSVPIEHLVCLSPPFLPYHIAEYCRRSFLYLSQWSIEQEAIFHAVPIETWDQLDLYIKALDHDLKLKERQLDEEWSWNVFDKRVRQNWKAADRLKLERDRMSEVMNSSGCYLVQHRQHIIKQYNESHLKERPIAWTDNLVERLAGLTTWKRRAMFEALEPPLRLLEDALTKDETAHLAGRGVSFARPSTPNTTQDFEVDKLLKSPKVSVPDEGEHVGEIRKRIGLSRLASGPAGVVT